MAERREFLASPEYLEVEQLLLRTIKRKGLYPRSGNGRNGALEYRPLRWPGRALSL